MRKFLLSLIINIILFAPAFADYVKTKDLNLSAADITELEIDCGAGYLMVEGVEGLENIEVEAEIVIEGMNRKKAQDFIDKHLRLDIREKRGHAVLRSHFDKSLSSFTLFGRKSSMVNLNVRIPVDMDLTIDDGSGDTRVENINGEVIIDDGSGDLELELIKGHTDIDDGSGEIYIINLDGNLVIDDGSGEIHIKEVTGDVEIDDGSGDISVRRIGGSVLVGDGSGDIRIRYVKQDVEIIDDSSGDVSIARVDGRVIR